MVTLVAVAVGIPVCALLACLGMRRIQSLPFTRSLALARSGDQQGIALQTVIIMVVLLAIAGGVAAVLLGRSQTATEQLENQTLGAPARSYSNEDFCRSAGFTWDGGKSGEHRCQYPDADACKAAGGDTWGAKTGGSQNATGKNCRAGAAGATFLGKIV